jgi:MFS family permease
MSRLAPPLSPAERDARSERALRVSVMDGFVYCLMVGVSESYLGPMAVELGHRDTSLALLLTVPMLVGSAAQLLAGPLSALLGARKRLVVLGAGVQALSVLGLHLIAKSGERALLPLLAVDTLYYVCAMIVGPPWGSWMADVTAGRQRERYFARRSAFIQIALLIAYGGAGALLHGASSEEKLETFALLHLLGFVFRLASTGMLALQPDIERGQRTVRQSVVAVKTAAQTADFRVATYLAALAFGTHIAVPFFTPYMLRELHMDYATFAGLTAIPIVVKMLLFPALHPLSQRYGMRKVLSWSGTLVVLLPAFWVVFDTPAGLILVQVLSGLAWCGLEYASYQLLLSSAREDCRVEFLSLASTMSGTAQLAGGLGGGYLRSNLGLSYQMLFLASAGGRALALGWMLGELPARLRREIPALFLRVISVRAGFGTVDRPIISDLPPPPPPAGDETEGESGPKKIAAATPEPRARANAR